MKHTQIQIQLRPDVPEYSIPQILDNLHTLRQIKEHLGYRPTYNHTNFLNAFKSIYSKAINDLIYKDNPFLRLIPKEK